jgi:mRNA interferase MazF
MAITSQEQRAGFPLTFELPADKLEKPSWVKISQARTISVERLGKRMESLSEEVMAQVVDGLLELIS